MIILKGQFVDEKKGSYLTKTGVEVFYRDVMIRTAPMKFETVRVPADYKLVRDKDDMVIFADSDGFSFGFTARRYDQIKKQFEYTPVSFFITKAK